MKFTEIEEKTFDEINNITCAQINGIITISDRTQSDIDSKTAKAYRNHTDLNRIEENIETVGALIAIPITRKTWTKNDLPRETADILRIRNSIESIRNGYGIKSDTPATPNIPLNTFVKMNSIEKILQDVYDVYEGTMNNFSYCGEIYCGDGIGVL